MQGYKIGLKNQKTEQVGDEDGVELSCYHSGFQIIP